MDLLRTPDMDRKFAEDLGFMVVFVFCVCCYISYQLLRPLWRWRDGAAVGLAGPVALFGLGFLLGGFHTAPEVAVLLAVPTMIVSYVRYWKPRLSWRAERP